MNQLKKLVQDWPLAASQAVELLRTFVAVTELTNRLSADQLSRVAETILSQRISNVLIFGLGCQSPFWRACNTAGRTVYIEDRSSVIAGMRSEMPEAEICPVSYATRWGHWQAELAPPLGWPMELSRVAWDVILIEAETEIQAGQSGQHSIWMASHLRKAGTSAFLFKYDRAWERRCADSYLGLPLRVIEGAGGALAEW